MVDWIGFQNKIKMVAILRRNHPRRGWARFLRFLFFNLTANKEMMKSVPQR